MNEKMKVIFLDVDGVINNASTTAHCGSIVGVDKHNLKWLKKIVMETSARIVLVSTWKDGWLKFFKEQQDESATYLDKKLKAERLFIMDKTTDNGVERGLGICEWLNTRDIEHIVILDDELFDYDETHLRRFLVHTDPAIGLSEELANQAIEKLNDENLKYFKPFKIG